MKKITLIFAVLAISASALFAQKNNEKSKKSPEEKAQKLATKWKDYLVLSDEQKQKFYDAKLAQINKIKALRDSAKGKENASVRPAVETAKSDFIATVKSFLTQEQFDKWMIKRSEMKNNSSSKGENRKGKGGKGKDKKSKDKDKDKSDDSDEDND